MRKKIILFRILGNDLSSLHGNNQTYDNLKFTLQNEPEFKNTKKMYLLNRIYDNKNKKKLVGLLEKYNAEYLDLPFQIEEFNKIKFNDKLMDGVKYKNYHKDLYDYNLYLINNNGARNYCINYGKKNNYDWIFPLDSNSYFTQDLFIEFSKIKNEDYIIIPQIRLANLNLQNNYLLKKNINYDKFPIQEPQIGFHKKSKIIFNDKIPYGFSPKAELLRVLQVPGKWNKWNDNTRYYNIKDRPKVKSNYKILSKVVRLNPNHKNNGNRNFTNRIAGVNDLVLKIKNDTIEHFTVIENISIKKNNNLIILLLCVVLIIIIKLKLL